LEQKQVVLEAAIDLLEYEFMKSKIKKEEYLKRFHEISSARASLGKGTPLEIVTPSNPDLGNRALRTSVAQGWRDGKSIEYIGIRPAYHDIRDSSIGFMRGTQIEFLDFEMSYSANKLQLEKATLLSLESLSQRTTFFPEFSWRMKTGFDKNFMDNDAHYIFTVGAGYSWGNEYGYLYTLADPFTYFNANLQTGVGGSVGVVLDKFKNFTTNLELTHRWYYAQKNQWLANVSENYRVNKKISLQFSYEYKEKEITPQKSYKVAFNYFF